MTATSAAWPCSWLQRPQQLRSHCRPLHSPAPGAQVRHAPLLFMLRRILYADFYNIICLCSSARLLAAVFRCCSSGVHKSQKMSPSIMGCRHHYIRLH